MIVIRANSGVVCSNPALVTSIILCKVLLPLRWPGFVPRAVHVGFVVRKVSLGQVFLRVLRFRPVNIIPPILHIHSVLQWGRGWSMDPLAAAVPQRHSLTPSLKRSSCRPQSYFCITITHGVNRVIRKSFHLWNYPPDSDKIWYRTNTKRCGANLFLAHTGQMQPLIIIMHKHIYFLKNSSSYKNCSCMWNITYISLKYTSFIWNFFY
jgi:hypothetical protein